MLVTTRKLIAMWINLFWVYRRFEQRWTCKHASPMIWAERIRRERKMEIITKNHVKIITNKQKAWQSSRNTYNNEYIFQVNFFLPRASGLCTTVALVSHVRFILSSFSTHLFHEFKNNKMQYSFARVEFPFICVCCCCCCCYVTRSRLRMEC